MSTPSKSPGKKRLLERYQADKKLETIREEAAAEEAASVKFTKTKPDVYYCGSNHQKEFKKVKTLYIEIENEGKIMVRTDSANTGTMKDLKRFLKEEFNFGYVNLTFSYKGKEVEDIETIVDQTNKKRQTIVLSQGVKEDHNGFLFSCETCRDANGMMKGSSQWKDFKKNHAKCQIYQKKFMENKLKWGYDCNIDKHNVLFGAPMIEGNPKRITQKYLASKNPTPSEDSDSQKKPTKKRKRNLRLPDNLVPDLTDNEVDEDSDGEEFLVLDETSKKVRRDNKVSDIKKTRTGKTLNQMNSDLDYPIPTGWEKSGLPEAKANRHEKIMSARVKAYEELRGNQFGHWKKTDEDQEIFEKKFLSFIYTNSAKYLMGQANMSAETRDNLRQGKEAAKGEEIYETKTAQAYSDALPIVMRILQKHLQRDLKLSYFFAFGEPTIIYPFNIYDLIEEDPCSVGMKHHVLYTYIHFVEFQRNEAEKNSQKFRSLVNQTDKSEAQIQSKAEKESSTFQGQCTSTIATLKTNATKINKAIKAKTLQNKKNNRELKNVRVPNPVQFLSKYWRDSEVKQLEKDLLYFAKQDSPVVTPGELNRLTNYVISSTLLKNGVRKQVVTTLKYEDFLRALSPDRLVYYPFRPKEGEDDDDGDDTPAEGLPKGFVLDKNRAADAPEGEEDYLVGALIEQDIHKTTLQGAAKLFLDKLDLIRWELYVKICKKYAKSIDQVYKPNGPMFINMKMEMFKGNLDWSIWKRVCEISEWCGHWSRNMLANFAASKKSLMLRELAAMAASHSLATQERTYRTHELQQLQVVQFSAYYREQCQITENEDKEKNTGLPYIDEEFRNELEEDLLEMTRSNQERFMEQEAAIDEAEVLTEDRSLTQNVKYHVFKLIIEADDTFIGGSKYNWGIHFPNDLMTGNEPRNKKNKTNFLMLLDYSSTKTEMQQHTTPLLENLIEFSKLEAIKDTEISDEKFIGYVLNKWTQRIMEMLHKFRYSTKVNEIRSLRLKDLLASYNMTHEYKYTFGNPELKRILKLHNEEQQASRDALKRIAQRDKDFTPERALKSYHDKAQKRAEKEAEKRLLEEDRRVNERDELYDSNSINQTPTKRAIDITAGNQTFTVSITPTKTSKRRLEDPRDNTPAKMRRGKSFEINKAPQTGNTNWTDVMLVQLLGHWILFSEYPYAMDHSYSGGKAAAERSIYRKKTLADMMKKCKIIMKTKEGGSYSLLLGNFSSIITIWDKLNKKGCGLKQDKGSQKKLLDHLDEFMERKEGKFDPVINIWTDKMAREGREELLEHMYTMIKDRPGESESGVEADCED